MIACLSPRFGCLQVRRHVAAAASKTVVIVESPTKANKIGKFLGSGVDVIASYGHFRQLPSKKGAVQPKDGFRMQWQIDPRRHDVLKRIEDAARGADTVVLATDPDREGEAISWHLHEYLRVRQL
jgi:DNA topoisomerase I